MKKIELELAATKFALKLNQILRQPDREVSEFLSRSCWNIKRKGDFYKLIYHFPVYEIQVNTETGLVTAIDAEGNEALAEFALIGDQNYIKSLHRHIRQSFFLEDTTEEELMNAIKKAVNPLKLL